MREEKKTFHFSFFSPNLPPPLSLFSERGRENNKVRGALSI